MERDTAIRLVRKLRALAADKAATPGEASVATAKADGLVARFGLSTIEARPQPPTPPRVRAAPAAGFKDWSRSAFDFGFDAGAAAERAGRFDPATGKATGPGVRVNSYTDRHNWRIEVDI